MVSVIVPLYNVEQYCEYSIRSILNSDYQDIELILIDDGSTDGTYSVCKQQMLKDKRVVLCTQSNKGVSGARNKGLSIAHGEYVTFVDGDDIVAPDHISTLVSLMADGVCMSMTSYVRVTSYDVSFPKNENAHHQIISVDEAVEKMLLNHLEINVSCAMFRRDRIADLIFPEGIKNNEDKYFLFQYMAHNQDQKVYRSAQQTYGYFVRTGSASRETNFSSDQSVIKVADMIHEDAVEKFPSYTRMTTDNMVVARIEFIKRYVLYSQKKDDLYFDVKKYILKQKLSESASLSAKVQFYALKIGDWAFALLVKLYYGIVNEKMRFRKNQRNVRINE